MTTRRQAASSRHSAAINRHVSVMVKLIPAETDAAKPPSKRTQREVNLHQPQQKVDVAARALNNAKAKAMRQATAAAARKRKAATRHAAAEMQKDKWALTREMLRREERAALRLNRKKLIRFRASNQIKTRHAAGVTRRGVNKTSVSRLAAKATRSQRALKSRTARLWTFPCKDDINLLGG